jgi:hypothetical protein
MEGQLSLMRHARYWILSDGRFSNTLMPPFLYGIDRYQPLPTNDSADSLKIFMQILLNISSAFTRLQHST